MKEFTFSPQSHTQIDEHGVLFGCHQAQVWGIDGKSLAVIEPTMDEREASLHAELLTDSLNIRTKTGLSPSELLEQRDELKDENELLRENLRIINNHIKTYRHRFSSSTNGDYDFLQKVSEQAINGIKQK